jgi:hypothetical protein
METEFNIINLDAVKETFSRARVEMIAKCAIGKPEKS